MPASTSLNSILDTNTDLFRTMSVLYPSQHARTPSKPTPGRPLWHGQYRAGFHRRSSGYFVVFADVDKNLVKKLNTHESFEVHVLVEKERTEKIDSFSGASSQTNEVSHFIANSHTRLITTAFDSNIPKRIAPVISKGLKELRAQRYRIREHDRPDGNTREVRPKPSHGRRERMAVDPRQLCQLLR